VTDEFRDWMDAQADDLVVAAASSDPLLEAVRGYLEGLNDAPGYAEARYQVEAVVAALCRRAGLAPTPTVELVTSAPEQYDGFGTTTVERLPYRTRGGGDLRRVRVQAQHLTWQSQRYASGLHLRVPLAEWPEWVAGGLAVPDAAVVS
jgi:hypothetical protein